LSYAELLKVDNALNIFLANEIAIPALARSRASTSQTYLRNVLRHKADADSTFPKVLAVADNDFIGGSFARHTKIWPLDDIDLFLPLDGGSLIYTNDGLRLPFTIATDQGSTRLSQPKWKTGTSIDSSKVLNGIRDAIRDTYPTSSVEIDKHCVNLQTGIAATSESEGIGFDVVPCFLMHPDNNSERFYLVPNGRGGWMRSSPRKDTDICAELQEFHGGTYRKAVRLVKYWNKTQLAGLFSSYYIELALMKRFNGFKTNDVKYLSVTQAFSLAMQTLSTAYSSGDLSSLLAEAPAVKAPMFDASKKSILDSDVANAGSVFRLAYNEGQADAAFTTLNAIFTTEHFG
jgi:hypothetical protein